MQEFICCQLEKAAHDVPLYVPLHIQDSLDLSYASSGSVAGTRNSLMVPPSGIDLTIHRTMR